MNPLTYEEALAWVLAATAIQREADAEVAESCKRGASDSYKLACDDIAALIRAGGKA